MSVPADQVQSQFLAKRREDERRKQLQQQTIMGTPDEQRQRQIDLMRRKQDQDIALRDSASIVIGSGNKNVPESFQAPDDVLEARREIAEETDNPALIGVARTLQRTFNNARSLLLKGARAAIESGAVPKVFGGIKLSEQSLTDIDNQLVKISQNEEQNREIYAILRDRRPEASNAELFTTLGIAFLVPGRKVDAAGKAMTTSRQASLASESVAGGLATLTVASPDNVGIETATGTFLGAGIFSILNGVTGTGIRFVGGRKANLQSIDELSAAERNLNVTGLLTSAEIRGGTGILPKIEGVMDNIPIPGLGLSGKREAQGIQFDNAVKQLQAAYPDIGEEQALRLIRGRLDQNEQLVRRAYENVTAQAAMLPDGAPLVQPTNLVKRAEEMLAKERAKGKLANGTVIAELEKVTKQEGVPFLTATEISGDFSTKIRKAERGASDPAATGIDAGRQKQLSLAYYRDMESWVRQFPESSSVFRSWEEAKSLFKETVLPFNKRPLAPVFDENGFDSYSLSKALMNPSGAAKLAKLDDSNALAFLYVNNLITQSTKNGKVNVKILANQLANAKNQKNLAPLLEGLPDDTVSMISSLSKLVDASPRAFLSNRSILQTTAGLSVAAGAGFGGAAGFENDAAGVAVGLASIGLMRFAVASPAGRSILTAAAKVPPSQRETLRALGRRLNISFIRYLESAAAPTATRQNFAETKDYVLDQAEQAGALNTTQRRALGEALR